VGHQPCDLYSTFRVRRPESTDRHHVMIIEYWA